MTDSKPITVFIIDDNETTRSILRLIIQSEHFTVVGAAPDGDSGVERALKLQPDIICLDVLMPKQNGLDVLVRLKVALPESEVLMVTVLNDSKTVKTAVERGASGFIVKPFNPGTVISTLEKIAEKVKAKRA